MIAAPWVLQCTQGAAITLSDVAAEASPLLQPTTQPNNDGLCSAGPSGSPQSAWQTPPSQLDTGQEEARCVNVRNKARTSGQLASPGVNEPTADPI